MRDVFSWSFPIGQLFGIMIRVHLVMPLAALGLIGREAVRTGPPPPISGTWADVAMLMLLLFLSVLLHELGHCFAARWMDGEADEILIWPLGGLAFCRSLPQTPKAHFVTALGGPLVNLVLCLLSGLALSFALDHHYQPPFNPLTSVLRSDASGAVRIPLWGGQADPSPVNNLFAIILFRFFWVNWFLLLLNVLLIGIPFDGGRMLQAALWTRMGHYQSSKIAIYCGFFFMVVIGLLSIVYTDPLLILLAMFIFVSCAQEMMALESAHEDSLFGYDFSQGYTSLEKDELPPPRVKKQNFVQRWWAKRAAQKLQREHEQREAEDRRMDELLDKIHKSGEDSLTDEEHRFLKRVADRYKNKP